MIEPFLGQPRPRVADIFASMSKADQERVVQMREWQRGRIAPQDDVQAMEFERGEATAIQKEAARRNIDRAKRDPELARKIVAGDSAARLAWDRWHWIA
jgi:CRISPR/Cas system-associated protein Csx1